MKKWSFNLVRVIVLIALMATVASAGDSWIGLGIRVQPAYFETNGLTSSVLGAGAEASLFPIKQFMAEARWSSSLYSNQVASDYREINGKDASPKLKPFTYWEAGAQLNLIIESGRFSNDETKTVQSGTRVSGKDEYGREVRVPVYKTVKTGRQFFTNEHRMLGIRGGIYELETGTDADVGASTDTIRNASNVIVTNLADNYTNHTMSGFYVGVTRTRIFYSEGLWNSVYVDVLVSNKIEFKDKVFTGYSNRKIGGRIGFEGARETIGGRLEAGVRPGVDKNRFYVLAQFSLGIRL